MMEEQLEPSASGGPVLRVHEAAAYLAVSRTTLYELMRSGTLPSIKIGGARRVLRVELDEYLRRLAASPSE